jgi:hypothetical protein
MNLLDDDIAAWSQLINCCGSLSEAASYITVRNRLYGAQSPVLGKLLVADRVTGILGREIPGFLNFYSKMRSTLRKDSLLPSSGQKLVGTNSFGPIREVGATRRTRSSEKRRVACRNLQTKGAREWTCCLQEATHTRTPAHPHTISDLTTHAHALPTGTSLHFTSSGTGFEPWPRPWPSKLKLALLFLSIPLTLPQM